MHKRIITSVLSLFFQSGYSAILGLIANLVLTILLSPTVFGMYITVLSMISLLNYFSDIGLAASLIQRKEITDDDIKTTFTVQQTLIVTLIIIGFLSTSFIRKFYNLPVEGIYLFWGLLLAFFISSLKTIPSIFLERKIQFQKIVQVQIIENTVFYLLVITLALLNFGVMSFTYAVITRAVIGLIAMYSISFWRPGFGISTKSLKQLLSFGIPFQASSFLALFKDDLITLFLGKVLGFEGLGYIGWAKKWAESPIRIIMDNISRVLFPVISRIQSDKQKISRLIEKLLNYQTTLLAPTLVGLALLMKPLVEIIPKYNKWEPALPFFYIFIVASFFSSYSTPFMNLFNALGKVKISFSFML
ncbi:oligosaccharide flippase family protein, partial [Candidatus Roizmanbacteria bacterium]|nr:oligosaccharide flippase family protein [Candidatus Roizmanbacteria bacterium]